MFDVKADGWFNVLRALRGAEIRTAVVFSSIAGRFGNARPDRLQRRQRSDCARASRACGPTAQTRAIAIDWTAWAEIGMASRGSIPKMMRLAGIDMLPPQVGITALRRELEAAGTRRRGADRRRDSACCAAERHPTGGLDPAAATRRLGDPHGPMIGRIEAMTVGGGLRVLTELDPAGSASSMTTGSTARRSFPA